MKMVGEKHSKQQYSTVVTQSLVSIFPITVLAGHL